MELFETDVFSFCGGGGGTAASMINFLQQSLICKLVHRILALEKLGAVFNQVSWPLQYTPRKFVIHPESSNLIIIETDHNAYTEKTKQQRKQQMAEVSKKSLVL